MHIFSLRSRPFSPKKAWGGVFALGNFDGVHLGHQAILQKARHEAQKQGRLAGCLVFEPHPQKFFRPRTPPFRLTSLHDKALVFRASKLDFLGVMRFTKALATLSAEDFVKTVLSKRLGAGHLVVGKDYRFGRGREGTAQTLCEIARPLGMGVSVVPLVQSKTLSSSQIREHLHAGAFEKAAKLLGRWWWMSGRVQKGAGRGAVLGFPTANISVRAYLRLPLGVYTVHASVLETGQSFQGVANLGKRPTFGENQLLFESHLFGCQNSLYGLRLLVRPLAFLRPEKRFASVLALKEQIVMDCEEARAHKIPKPLWTTPPSPC